MDIVEEDYYDELFEDSDMIEEEFDAEEQDNQLLEKFGWFYKVLFYSYFYQLAAGSAQ